MAFLMVGCFLQRGPANANTLNIFVKIAIKKLKGPGWYLFGRLPGNYQIVVNSEISLIC